MDDQRNDPMLQKGPNKGTDPNNYRPITCLPMMWKILPAQIREEIYYSLTSRGLFPDEQKRCCKGSRDTAELLYIDQHILNESKTKRKNLAMARIDYRMKTINTPDSNKNSYAFLALLIKYILSLILIKGKHHHINTGLCVILLCIANPFDDKKK